MTFQAKAGNERGSLIVPVRNARQQSLSAPCAAPQASQLGIGAAFIHKNQSSHRLDGQLLMPVRPSFGHVGPVALGGGQSFF